GRGTPATPISFAGTTFAVAPTDAVYKFNSYRGTWSYRVYQGTAWTWRVGFTGFVRDARVALTQADRAAEDTDVGFVPLGHVSGEARLAERVRLAQRRRRRRGGPVLRPCGALLNGNAHPQRRRQAGLQRRAAIELHFVAAGGEDGARTRRAAKNG